MTGLLTHSKQQSRSARRGSTKGSRELPVQARNLPPAVKVRRSIQIDPRTMHLLEIPAGWTLSEIGSMEGTSIWRIVPMERSVRSGVLLEGEYPQPKRRQRRRREDLPTTSETPNHDSPDELETQTTSKRKAGGSRYGAKNGRTKSRNGELPSLPPQGITTHPGH